MSKFWIILIHTYWNKLKSKSFLITTIITSLLIFGVSNIENIIHFFNKDERTVIAVIDETTELFPVLKQQMSSIDKKIQLEVFTGIPEEAEKFVENEAYEGVLTLSFNNDQLPRASYKANSITNSETSHVLQNALQQIKLTMATTQLGLTEFQIEQLYQEVEFETIALQEHAKTEQELNTARGLVYVLLFMIYMAVIMYANMIAMEVATEKSSRVMEILISSVSPVKQMFGKILGIALLSITQFSVFLGVGYQSIRQASAGMETGFLQFLGFDNIPISTIIYAIVFFVLGYLLFATMAAVLGSLVSRIEDVQQMVTPMTLLVVAAFMIAMFGLNDPQNPFITTTSFIPFFSPMIMFLRVGMIHVPGWEIALGIGLLVATIVLLALFGARVYRGGVLIYDKSSSFKDIKKALQLSRKS
jgi:ABC-2 type transport system permease protein